MTTSQKQNELNIALICDSIDHITGGSFTSVRRFASELKKRGHNLIIITTRGKNATAYSDRFKDYTVYRFSASMGLGPDKFKLILFRPSSLEKILIQHKINVIYAIHPIYSGYIALRVAKKLHLPVIMHLHVQPENLVVMSPLLAKAKIVIYKYLLFFFNKSNMVLCPSKFAQELLLTNGIKAKTRVISNGVNLDTFKKLSTTQTDYLYDKYNLKPSHKNLLVVSRLSLEKRVDIAIKAMPNILLKFPDAQMIIVGGGILFKKLTKLIKKLDLSDSVKLLGKVPEEDIVPLYNLGKIFIHPSLVELEGIVLLEAIACGLPLLVSDSKSSAAANLIDGNGETFRVNNYRDLANKVEKLFSSDILLERMANKSSKLAHNYDISKSIDILEEVFEQEIAFSAKQISQSA
jgi:1,2-diacylglycerol 3-alpha-glucosyltransferase